MTTGSRPQRGDDLITKRSGVVDGVDYQVLFLHMLFVDIHDPTPAVTSGAAAAAVPRPPAVRILSVRDLLRAQPQMLESNFFITPAIEVQHRPGAEETTDIRDQFPFLHQIHSGVDVVAADLPGVVVATTREPVFTALNQLQEIKVPVFVIQKFGYFFEIVDTTHSNAFSPVYAPVRHKPVTINQKLILTQPTMSSRVILVIGFDFLRRLYELHAVIRGIPSEFLVFEVSTV